MKNFVSPFVLILLICEANYAQVPFFQSYFLLKRNEPIQVNVIYQDNTGFIWAGTNKGLFRFDGISQQRFTRSDSLPDDNVTAITEDSLGRIWTGHKNGQVAFMENSRFHNFDPPEGTSTEEITDMLFDRRGNLWFSTLNDGLYYFTKSRLYRVDEQNGMPDLFVYDIMEDPGGNIWAGTDGGAAICTLADGGVSIKVLDYDHGLPDNIIKKLLIDDNNRIWMGTEDAGVIIFDSRTGLTKPLISGDWPFGATSDFVLHGGKVWIASPQSGLIVYDIKTRQTEVYRKSSEFDFTTVNVLVNDVEGNIWFGSRGGMARTLVNGIEYLNSFDPYSDTNVLCLTTDDQDNLWYATSEGLFKRWLDEGNNVHLEKMLLNTPYQKYTAISMYTDSKGFVWIGFYGEGVIRIDPHSGKIEHLARELANGNVLSITGFGNEVWLATLGGATRVNISEAQLEVKNYSGADGLVSDYIYQVFVDSQERVWFATDGRGAVMLDHSGFHHYEDGLNSKVVYGIAEDGNHTVWLNVQGEGLYQFDGRSFKMIHPDTPLRNKNVNCFSSDEAGNLIMMHDLGIDIYDINRNRIHSLGDEVGMQTMKPNLNALTKDRYGRIFLGTDHGIIRYSMQQDNSPALPRPAIAGVSVMDRKINFSSSITLAYDENRVIMNYLGFWYQNPRSLNFQYKLENYDRDWIESIDRSATYSSLPPGDYRFILRVSDSEDFKDSKETSFSFAIRPPFWRTIWFYLLSALVIVSSGFAYLKFSERKLVRDKVILEFKVKQRTLEIQKQKEEIQAQNEEIQSQAEEIQGINDNLESLVRARTAELEKKTKASEDSAFIIAHELRAPVASVLGLINLISKCDVDDETKVIITHMEESAEKLNGVVREITKAIERGDK